MVIQKADLKARHKILLVLGLVLISASVAYVLMDESLVNSWRVEIAEILVASPYLIPVFSFLLIVVPVVLMSVYLFIKGKRVCQYQRFPVPGEIVIRDTEVRVGKSAVTVGRLLQFLALIMAVCALAIPILLTKILYA